MNLYYHLFLFSLLKSFNASEISYHRNMFRNTKLRFLIACNYRKYKNTVEYLNRVCLEKIFHFQENTKIKYMELSNKYYSLSEEDRYLLENMFDLIL